MIFRQLYVIGGISLLSLFSCTMAKTSLSLDSFLGSPSSDPTPSPSPTPSETFVADSVTGDTLSASGYVILTGQCYSRVTGFEVSATLMTGGDTVWHALSSTEVAQGTEVNPPSIVYDDDCSDGSFLVFVFRHNLKNWFSADVASGENNINKFYIRGVLADGTTTSSLTVHDESMPKLSTPTLGQIYKKTAPWNLIEQGSCTPAIVSLQDTLLKEASSSTAVNVKLVTSLAGGTSTSDFYLDASCTQTIVNGDLTFAAAESKRTVYLKTTENIGAILNYGVIFNGVTSLTLTLKVKDTTDQFLMYDGPTEFVAGSCYSVKVSLNEFSGTVTAGSGGVTFGLNGFTGFTNSTCTTTLTAASISLGESQVAFYGKRSAGASAFDWNLSPSSGPVEGFTQRILTAVSTNQTIANAQINESKFLTVNAGDCQKYEVVLNNEQGKPVPNNLATYITLNYSSTVLQGTPIIGMYGSATCTSPVTSLSIPKGDFRSYFYLKGTAPGSVSVSFSSVPWLISSVPVNITIQ